jgi:hypothetical protein
MSSVVERVENLEHWRDGNGKPGAAAMIASFCEGLAGNNKRDDAQDKYIEAAKIEAAISKAAEKQALVEAVEEVMRKRGRSVEGMIRAFGPYFAAICALAAAALTMAIK